MRRLLAVAALGLILCACEARAEIEVRDDGSGTFGFSFVVEDQFLAMLSGFGAGDADPFDEFKKSLADSPVAFEIKEFEESGGKGIRAQVPFKDEAELRRIMKEMDDTDASSSPLGGGGPGFGSFTLERRGDGWHFEAVSEAPDLGDLGDLSGADGSGSGSSDFGPSFDPAEIAKLLKVSFRVTLPGRSVTTTADDTAVAGNKTTFVWTADLSETKPMTLVATTSGGGSSGFPVIPVAAGAAGLAALLVAIKTLTSRRRALVAVEGPAPASGETLPPPVAGDVPEA